MKRNLLFIFLWLGFGILLQSCRKDDDNGGIEEKKEYSLPVPELMMSNPVPCLNEEVEFSFKTDEKVSSVWNFGDEASSGEKTVTHRYAKEGTFKISLELSDGQGGTVKVDTTISVMGRRLNDAIEELSNKPGQVWVCSHRGNTYYGQRIGSIPENSVEAIQRAVIAGAEMVEIDVRSTSDGELIVMHDATIDRTTNGVGNVSDMTLSVLKRFSLKAVNGVVTTSVIPTLEEALLAGRGKIFYELDIKKGVDTPTLVNLVESLHMLDRVVFYYGSSKDKAKEVTDANSQCIVFPFVENTSVIEYWATDPRIKMVQADYGNALAGEIVSAAKAQGMVSFTSYISDLILNNDFTVVDIIRELQYQVILTNYVEMLKPYLDQKHG
ncbi:glycerophosphodiester phosphodiesterase family protein [Gaoshiqia sp. Z1-71]|uniref:glycerophosphodiester phosphodiesterase family protein n=1 Tax=Gaoshiqia hydrogeniformans TaxID=3290090 RepID=UPI003BF88E96